MTSKSPLRITYCGARRAASKNFTLEKACRALARKIVSSWNEDDLVTRVKLPLALGQNDAHDFDFPNSNPERWNRMRAELEAARAALSVQELQEARDFLERYEGRWLRELLLIHFRLKDRHRAGEAAVSG